MRTIKEALIQNSVNTLSLFSGAGGLDIGAIQAGAKIIWANDMMKDACDSYSINIGDHICQGDINSYIPSLSQYKGNIDLVIGGPPCQGFSVAGKMDEDDERSKLIWSYVKVLETVMPKAFVMENVKGIISAPLKHTPLAERDKNDPEQHLGTVLDVILSEFNKLGYKTVYGVLDAVNYGVPQFRERFVLIGSRDNEDIFLPFPTHFQMHQDPAYRWRTLQDTIKDLEHDCGECAAFSKDRLAYLRLVPEGGNWRDLPEAVRMEAMGGAYGSGGGKVGFYRRPSYSQPSPTLVTSPVQKATMMCHPTQDRPLSIQEYARIQQFPDDWKFMGTSVAKYRQIGNAVPVGLASALGKAVLSVADQSAEIRTKRFRGTDIHQKLKQAIELGGSCYANK